MVTPVTEITTS